MDKVVYDDAGQIKVLRGKILAEDFGFLKIEMSDGTIFELNRTVVKHIRRGSEDE